MLLRAPEVIAALELLETSPPFGVYAMFRALCRHGLQRWFERTTDVVPLQYGDAFPSVVRPLRGLRSGLTPTPTTTSTGHLLEGTTFRLWRHNAGARITAELDYSARELLEDAAWHPERDGRGPLPVIATVHPYEDWSALRYDAEDGAFFNVRPAAFPHERVLEQLGSCDGADICVLPELSLSEPEALSDALANDPGAFPRLVVAGSAHITEPDGSRRNLSVTYLDGVPVLRARKIHPLVYRPGGGAALREDLTEDPAVLRCLCSTTTRMAVVICADLNDDVIPGLLQQLGVNLLLVPTLTPHEGGFSGAVSLLASLCQGISVVVNGSPPPGGEPCAGAFMILAAAPCASAEEQVESYGPPEAGRRAVGQIDVNQSLAGAVPWAS